MRALFKCFALAASCALTLPLHAGTFDAAIATYEQTQPFGTWSASLAIDGKTDGNFSTTPNAWSILNTTTSDPTPAPQTAYFRMTTPMQLTASHPTLEIDLNQTFGPDGSGTTPFHTLGAFRLAVTTNDLHASAFNLTNATADTWTNLLPSSFVINMIPDGPAPGFTIDGTGRILVASPGPAKAIYTITANLGTMNVTGIRLEALPDPSLPFGGPGFTSNDGNFALVEITASAIPEPASLLMLSSIVLPLCFRRTARR